VTARQKPVILQRKIRLGIKGIHDAREQNQA
jgi:hypothetical protein